MACLEPVKRILEEDRPETYKIIVPYHNQQRFAFRPRPINTNNRSAKSNLSLISKKNPLLEQDHPHIKMNSNDAIHFKTHILTWPKKFMKFFTTPFQTPIF